RPGEDLVILAEDGKEPVAQPDGLDAGQDRVTLVEQEPAEVGKVGAAVQVLRAAPRAGRPGVVELNLPGKRKRAEAKDAGSGVERPAVNDGHRPFLDRAVRHQIDSHSLATNLRQ